MSVYKGLPSRNTMEGNADCSVYRESTGFQSRRRYDADTSAMHAREARQIIAGVHDKPRLCGIDIHSAPTGRTDAGGGERELMQRGFLQDKTVVITVAVEQLQSLSG